MIKHLIHILTLIFAIQVSAQNPPKIKFKKIETSNFTLVFPNEITENAQKAANLLEYYFAKNSAMLKVNPQKTTLFLYNQSVESNGYASLLPKKMVWYTTSPQNSDLGSMDWFNTLALHEFRHIIQYAKNNQHFTRFAGIFYGQNAQLGLRYSIPRWYMEGDAVFAETFFSQNGRGRIPKFDMPLRTIALSDQKFSYDQAVFGSFKRYFPDHYCLGYHLVNYSMVQHGSEVWEKTYNRATKYSYWPYAFSRSLKKVSGENLQQTYKNAMLQLDSIWHAQQIQLEITNCNQINTKQKKRWTNYVDPIFVNDLVILARKSSLDEPNSFVLIDVKKGTESVLFQTDAGKFSYSATKLVWVSEMPDERWTEKSFSNIWMYDFEYIATGSITMTPFCIEISSWSFSCRFNSLTISLGIVI